MAVMATSGRTAAIFGGSFNPPHVGHVLAAAYVRAVYAVDEVLVIPVFDHPFDKELVPFAARLEMARLAMESVAGITVSDIEQQLGGESRTLYTIEALLKQQPQRALRLVVGADVLHDRHKWHRFDRIEALAPPIILGRAGVVHPEAPAPLLPEVSSTTVRRLLATGDTDTCRPLLPAAVLSFIQANRLYSAAGSA